MPQLELSRVGGSVIKRSRSGVRADNDTVKSVVQGDNDDLMVEVAKLWIGPRDEVFDMTYGEGVFWKKYCPYALVPWTGDFMHIPQEDHGYDVVVYDPPYVSTGGNETSTIPDFNERFGMGQVKGWQNLFDYNATGLAEAVRLSKRTVMVKCCDFVESGHKRWGHRATVEAADKLGLDQVDEFILVSGTGPQPKKNLDGSLRRQVHSRRAHSFLCIFRLK